MGVRAARGADVIVAAPRCPDGCPAAGIGRAGAVRRFTGLRSRRRPTGGCRCIADPTRDDAARPRRAGRFPRRRGRSRRRRPHRHRPARGAGGDRTRPERRRTVGDAAEDLHPAVAVQRHSGRGLLAHAQSGRGDGCRGNATGGAGLDQRIGRSGEPLPGAPPAGFSGARLPDR